MSGAGISGDAGETDEFGHTAIFRDFVGGERRFELTIGAMKALEQRLNAGVGDVYRRILAMSFALDDVRQTIRFGLVGGSAGDARPLSAIDAEAIMMAGCDGVPLSPAHDLAKDILIAAFCGVDKSGKMKGLKTAAEAATRGTSAPITSPAAPAASPPATSTP